MAVFVGTCAVAVTAVPWLVLQVPGGREHYLFLEQIVLSRIAAYGALLVVVLYALPRLAQRSLRELGMRSAPFGQLAIAAAAGVLLIAVAFANDAVARSLFASSASFSDELFDNVNAALVLPTYGVLTVLVAPFVEELFFRGFVLTAVRERASAPLAIATSAVVFALLHYNARETVPLLAGGVVYGVLYERTRSLTVPIVAHVTYNAIAFGLLFALPR